MLVNMLVIKILMHKIPQMNSSLENKNTSLVFLIFISANHLIYTFISCYVDGNFQKGKTCDFSLKNHELY